METTATQRNWIILGLSCMTFLVSTDMIAVNLVLPSLAGTFKSNVTGLQWVLTIYTLFSAIFAIMAGKLGDLFGVRRFLLVGVFIFSLASLGVALAPELSILMACRAIQGLGYAFIIALSNVMIYIIYPKERVAGALGMVAGMGALAAALGPVLVGVLLQFLDWRAVFLFNVPVGLVSAYLLLKFSPVLAIKAEKQPLDWLGASIFAIALCVFLLALNQLHEWSSTLLSTLVGVGVVLSVVFVAIEQRIAFPLFRLSLFKNKVFMLANGVRVIVSYVMFSLLFLAVLFLDTVFHYSPMATSFLFCIVAIAMVASAILFGRLSLAWGPYWPLMIASIIITVFFAYSAFNTESFGLVEFILYFCAGLAFGVMRPGIAHIVLRAVPEAEIGVSNAISSMVLPIGGMIGVALSGWLLSSQSEHALILILSAQHIVVPASIKSTLFAMAQGAQNIDHLKALVVPEQFSIFASAVKEAFLHAYFIIMILCSTLFFLTFLLLCWAKSQDHFGRKHVSSGIDVVV